MKYVCVAALSIVTALWSAAAYAQEDGIPKEVLDDLAYNVGNWTTKVEFGKQVTEGKWSAKWSAEGKCLILHMSGVTLDKEGKGDGVKSFATGVVGWDGPNKAIKELVFWSDGSVYDARYLKTSPTTWEGAAKGVVGGKEFTEKVSITRDGEDSFVWKAFKYVLGGEEQPDITTTFSKVPEADKTQDREKLAKAFGWMMGNWELAGSHEQFGDWVMQFSFHWDVDETVVVWRVTFEMGNVKWSLDSRNYWDRVDQKIRNITFSGQTGRVDKGYVVECSENAMVWHVDVVGDDGKTIETEVRFSLREDGNLVFQHFGLLDDGSMRENWKFELTEK